MTTKKKKQGKKGKNPSKLSLKKKAMIEALKKNMGSITLSTEKVGIHRRTHYDWLEADPLYKEEYENIDNYVIDFVENALHKNINKGNVVAQIFYLKTKAKHRGYVERVEQEHIGSVPVSIIINREIKEVKKDG